MDDPAFHEVANAFPLMGEEDLQRLADDIAANGLREPIWRHRDGRIIDGRNRWLACQRAGVTCHSHTYQGDDAGLADYVDSLNFHRRHLTNDQKAALAADIATRKVGSNRFQVKVEGGIPPSTSEPLTLAAAAEMHGVKREAVVLAKALKRDAPDLHEKVKSGEMKASEARREVQQRANAGKGKGKGQSKGRPGKPKANLLPDKPEHVSFLPLLLRNGAKMVAQFGGDAEEAVRLANVSRVFIDPNETRILAEFLGSLLALVDVDRAA